MWYNERVISGLFSEERRTLCAKTGMNPKTLQYVMGHSDIGITLGTYTHLKIEDAQEEFGRVMEAQKCSSATALPELAAIYPDDPR